MRTLIIALLCLLCTPALADPGADRINLIYHIFIRSFRDSNGDGIGDLKGITEQLDYLNDGNPETDHDLEVGVLWLMPLFPTKSYHGYDVTDYRQVNPEYGTIEDLKDLVEVAHARGVRVILDLPINHTSDKHPWFEQATDPTSPFREYYHFRADDSQHSTAPWHLVGTTRYKGIFSARMPDLNFYHEAVRRDVKEIAKFWLDKGIDGFRLDAAKHIYGDTFGQLSEDDILKNNDWWREFSQHVYHAKPDAVLVGEILDGGEMLRRHSWGLDGLVDEPFMNEARNHIAWPKEGMLTHWKAFLEACQELNRSAYDPAAGFPDQPFQPFIYLASHDKNPRLASHLEDQKDRGMKPSVDEAYRLGTYMLLCAGRYPILYNGDEVMQRGWKWNGNPPDHPDPGDGSGVYDETLREPFPWYKARDGQGQTTWFEPRFDKADDGVSVEEQAHEHGVLHLIRGLTNFRARHPTFANGNLGAILTDSKDWIVFERMQDDDRYVVLINTTANGNSYRFHQDWFPQYVGAKLLFWSDGAAKKWVDESGSDKQIEDSVYVAPYGLVVLKRAN